MNSRTILWPPLLALLTACFSNNQPPQTTPQPTPTLPPSFQLALNPTNSSLTLNQGGKNTLQLTLTPENSFSATVGLSLEKQDGAAVPTGFTLSPNTLTVADSANPSNHTVTLEIAPDTPTGSYPLRLKAVAGDLSQSANFTLEVVPPGLQLALAQETVGLTRGATTTFTLNLVPQGNPNTNTTISLVLENRDGSPAPASLSLSPGTATVSSNAPVPLTLTLTSTPSTPTGPMALRIRAQGGGLDPGCGDLCADLELFVGARGELDPTFGNNGVVLSGDCSFRKVAIQPDGKLVVLSDCADSPFSRDNQFVTRYNLNGSPDTSFGTAGRAKLRTRARDLVVQPDGKIVVGLENAEYSLRQSFPVVRYNPDGSLDTAFGSGGEAAADDIGSAWVGKPTKALTLQPDGKIVAVGGDTSEGDCGMVRYNPDGSVDTSFGTRGTVFSLGCSFNDLALRPDGKIVLAGTMGPRNSPSGAVFGYNPDGSPDTTFGTNGMSFGPRIGYDAFGAAASSGYSALALRPDGGIIAVGGYSERGAASKTYESTFNRSGNFSHAGERFYGGYSNVVVQPDGRYVVSGTMNTMSWAQGNFITLARFYGLNTDTTFGTNGLVVANNEQNLVGLYNLGLVLQPNGKIVASLWKIYHLQGDSYRYEYSLIRYH